ncbi:alpha/beta fold hydrolase [Bacillus sp. BHET2]|uniref:alpha/beta fold hydrolase n=1 Tax=Bacillus sp. BHET2 TaxID=2583818 RepID=UPI00110F05C6|nr:alpha/beta fold hydrolase [Bacillus sp. BHET2]TMU87593.1 alpha/beta fold hydrolase [Bacillus sp. BHET2]
MIFYDQIGCGKSDDSVDGTYSIEREIENLELLRAALGLKTIHIFGESWGSVLALSYAAKYTKNIERIVLTAVIGLNNQGYHDFKRGLLGRMSIVDKMRLGIYGMSKTPFDKITRLLDRHYVYSQETLKRKAAVKFNREANKQISRELGCEFDLIPIPEGIHQIPIMIAQGSADILPPSYVRKEMIPHLHRSILVEVEKSGHWTIVEQTASMLQLSYDFLKDG